MPFFHRCVAKTQHRHHFKVKNANYLAYLLRNPCLRDHPSPMGKCWELVNIIYRPLRHCKPALPDHLSGNYSDRIHSNEQNPDNLSEYDSDGNSNKEQDLKNNGDSDIKEYDSESEVDSESGDGDNDFDDIDYSTDEDYSDIESDSELCIIH